MKIIHLADVHLDSKMEGFSLEFSKTRRAELLSTFERVVEYADKNFVKVIIIAGDMFDTNFVSEKTKNRLISLFKNYSNIDFLYLNGNHDKNDFFKEVSIVMPNVKAFSENWINYNYGRVNICGINGENGFDYGDIMLPAGDFNIAVMHGQIVDYETNDKTLISLAKLKDKNLDYIALGHLHSHVIKRVDYRAYACYSGCLEGRGFDEVGKKGFVLIDTESDKNKITFVPFASREIFVKEYKYLGEDILDFYQNIFDDIKKSVLETDILKVVLRGEIDDPLGIDLEFLHQKISPLVSCVFIENKIKYNFNRPLNSNKTIKDEFISLVSKTDMENLMKNEVIMCGIKALSGEEI